MSFVYINRNRFSLLNALRSLGVGVEDSEPVRDGVELGAGTGLTCSV